MMKWIVAINLNTGPIFFTHTHTPDLKKVLVKEQKYRRVRLEEARSIDPTIKILLDQVPLFNGFKHTYVDVKIQHLKKGSKVETTGPHIDFRLRPADPSSFEINHLWCNEVPTYMSRVLGSYEVEDFASLKDEPSFRVPTDCWVTYDRHQLHWGGLATKRTKRLFMRVSQTMENYR